MTNNFNRNVADGIARGLDARNAQTLEKSPLSKYAKLRAATTIAAIVVVDASKACRRRI